MSLSQDILAELAEIAADSALGKARFARGCDPPRPGKLRGAI